MAKTSVKLPLLTNTLKILSLDDKKQCNGILVNEIWQKEFRIGPLTLGYLLNMICPGIEKMITKFMNAITMVKRLPVAL